MYDVNALFAVNALTSMYGNYQQAKAGKRQYANLTESMVEDVNAIALRSRQDLYQTKQKVGMRARQAMADSSRLNAIAADTNLTGGTATALRQQILMDRDQDTVALQQGASNRLMQSRSAIRATSMKYRNAMGGVKTPSVIGTGLSLFGDALDQRGPSVRELFD